MKYCITSALALIFWVMPAYAVSDLVEELAKVDGASQEEATEQVKQVFTAIEKVLQDSGEVKIRNYGTFYLQKRDAREARNPKTGESVKVPARAYPKFRSSDSFKKRINS